MSNNPPRRVVLLVAALTILLPLRTVECPSNNREQPMPNDAKPPIGFAAKLAAALMFLVFTGIGVVQIVTEHAYSSTNKYGGSASTFDGRAAVLHGLGMVAFGLVPLAFFFKRATSVGVWMSAWLVLGLYLLIYAR